jgi:hypothetical protein
MKAAVVFDEGIEMAEGRSHDHTQLIGGKTGIFETGVDQGQARGADPEPRGAVVDAHAAHIGVAGSDGIERDHNTVLIVKRMVAHRAASAGAAHGVPAGQVSRSAASSHPDETAAEWPWRVLHG